MKMYIFGLYVYILTFIWIVYHCVVVSFNHPNDTLTDQFNYETTLLADITLVPKQRRLSERVT